MQATATQFNRLVQWIFWVVSTAIGWLLAWGMILVMAFSSAIWDPDIESG